jgi:hypothetical protein
VYQRNEFGRGKTSESSSDYDLIRRTKMSGSLYEELKKKWDKIADLEKKHKVVGVRFAVREGAKVGIDEAMGYVAKQIEKSAELIKHREILIDHGRSAPR